MQKDALVMHFFVGDSDRHGRSLARRQVRTNVRIHGTDDAVKLQRDKHWEDRWSARAARKSRPSDSETEKIGEPLLVPRGLVRREGRRAHHRAWRGDPLCSDGRHHRSRHHNRRGNKP